MRKIVFAAVSVLLVGASAAAVHAAVVNRTASGTVRTSVSSPALAARGVEDAFAAAMSVHQRLGLSPTSAAFFARHGSAAAPPMPSSSELLAIEGADVLRIDGSFAGTQAARERTYSGNAVRAQIDPSFRFLGGGVGHITFTHVQVAGDRASVAALVPTWSEVAQIRPTDGRFVPARPQGVLDATASMVLVAGRWKVETLNWTFVPGTGP